MCGHGENRTLGGIVFVKTKNLQALKDFYIERIGCTLWLDQGACAIFQYGNLLLGFCERDTVETQGVYTFFYTDKHEVDHMYSHFKYIATSEPKENTDYQIYHFYAKDPDGRIIEFQHFLNDINPF